MGSIAASATIGRAQIKLLDPGATPGGQGTTWNTASQPGELLDDYNASVRLICAYKADVSVTTGNTALVAGPRQTVPGHNFIGLKSNSAGIAITQVDMDDLDHCRPSWRNDTAAPPVHWMADRKQPNVYWTYPPAVAADTAEAIFAAVPPPLTSLSQTNPLDDVYEEIIYWLVLAHAYSKRAKRGDLQKMGVYVNLASQALGLKAQMQLQQAPAPTALAQRGEG